MKKWVFMAAILIISAFNIFSQMKEFSLWFNSYRETLHLKELQQDELLDLTALKYAKEIAQTGHYSHKDLKGQRVQDRYVAVGGTHALVGEILGIGPDREKIIHNWLNSEKHLAVIEDKRWTHYGQGIFYIKNKLIYVLLFSEQFTAKLTHNWNHTKKTWHLTGQWLLPGLQPILYNGTKPVLPEFWDQATRKFSYQIQAPELSAYLRLGYKAPGKAFHITNIFYPYK